MTRISLFNAIRPFAPEGRFNLGHVKIIDDLADLFGLPRTGQEDWLPYALTLIKRFEGCKLTAYPDPGTGGKPWTIGWGSTTDEKDKPIQPGTVWTQDRADQRLATHVAEFAAGVSEVIGDAPTAPAQKGAMVSLAYNIGVAAFARSSVASAHKRGDYGAAARAFPLWNKAGGRVVPGLVKRRAAEAAIYLGEAA